MEKAAREIHSENPILTSKRALIAFGIQAASFLFYGVAAAAFQLAWNLGEPMRPGIGIFLGFFLGITSVVLSAYLISNRGWVQVLGFFGFAICHLIGANISIAVARWLSAGWGA